MTGASRDNTVIGRDFGVSASRSARLAGRLETWKEIGAFLGRDARTAKRWEAARGLPIHRIPGAGRSKVYAFADELAAWLNGVGPESELAELSESDVSLEVEDASDGRSGPGPRGRIAAIFERSWVAPAVAGIVMVVLLGTVIGLIARPARAVPSATPSAEAVQLYQAGLHDWNTRTPEGLHMAVDDFTQAIVRDPGYAPAYAGLANCYNLLREYTNMSPADAYPRAKAAALRAIALDDRMASGHLALAFEQFYWEWNTSTATREFRRAIALDPNSATAHHWYANYDLQVGKFSEALTEITRAQQLDPLSTAILADKATIFYTTGRPRDAIAILQGIERTSPTNLSPHAYLANMYLDQGDGADYVSEMHKTAELLQDSTRAAIADAAGRGWTSGGRRGLLTAVLTVQLGLQARGLVSNYDIAKSYARLGDNDDALNYLAASQAARESDFTAVKVDEAFLNLHRSQRFAAFTRSFNV